MKCEKCGRSILGRSYSTPLGHQVCASCHDTVNGLIIGGASGGAGGAAVGPGLMKWVREGFGSKR